MKPIGIAFQVVFGIKPGYDDASIPEGDPAQIVSTAFLKAADAELKKTEILVTAAFSSGTISYWSPREEKTIHEPVAIATGNSNPVFVADTGARTPFGDNVTPIREFREAVVRVVAATRGALQQERVQLAFMPMDGFVYLEPEEAGGEKHHGMTGVFPR
tara:strand:+ start:522 stop:998 length:477 start_codon:yes stop_codon:yes gene_type:complete